MSSTEPPSRIPPRQGSHESKAAHDELSSKGKVEKVREVDPDEQTRKKKFLKCYEGESAEDTESENRPSPFDLYSEGNTEKGSGGSRLGTTHHSSGSDVENAVIPSPSNTPPPNLGAGQEVEEEGEEDELTNSNALPQADDFWEDVNLLDQPHSSENSYKETPDSSNRTFITRSPEQTEHKRTEDPEKKKAEDVKGLPIETSEKKEKSESVVTPARERKKKDHEKLIAHKNKKKVEQISKQKNTRERVKDQKDFEEKPISSPRVEKISPRPRKHAKKAHEKKEREEQTEAVVNSQVKPETEERGFQSGHKRDPKRIEVDSLSSPPLPQQVVPNAHAATTQAAHYLHPTTVSLFFPNGRNHLRNAK